MKQRAYGGMPTTRPVTRPLRKRTKGDVTLRTKGDVTLCFSSANAARTFLLVRNGVLLNASPTCKPGRDAVRVPKAQEGTIMQLHIPW